MTSPKTKSKPSKAAISYQGEPGANSHIACKNFAKDLAPQACPTFEDAIAAVRNGAARYAMIPVENSVAGRVADVHHLLPNSGLHIVGEHFERISHQLMALPAGHDRDDQDGAQPHPCAGSMPHRDPRAGPDTPRRGRHGGGGAHDRGRGRPHQGGHRLEARRRDLRPQDFEERHRGRCAQHHALPGARARSPRFPRRTTARW